MRDEKEERKKQARSNKQTRQSNTAHPRQSLFLEKMSCLRWDSNPRHSTLQTEHVHTLSYLLHTHTHTPSSFSFSRFFRELNSQLLRTMLEAADSEDHLLTVDMLESVGLDATRDRLFLTELAAQLNFDLNVQRPSDMMDLLSCCC